LKSAYFIDILSNSNFVESKVEKAYDARAMRLECEIAADEFVSSQILYQKLSGGRKRIERMVYSFLASLIFFGTAWTERSKDLSPFLFAIVGAWLIYSGAQTLFPSRFLRSAYWKSEVVGKRFHAEINEEDFEVTGDLCSWRIRWPGVIVKGESELVFMLCSNRTIFMFGKKHLSSDQQQQLRKLSGLT
jgi:hypothetical protein